MMKKKLLYTVISLILFPLSIQAYRVDSTAIDPDKYVPELGYFQKAHTDASDPRYMITDNNGRFSIGIGGTVQLVTFYDFGGAIDDYSFSPGTIAIPVDRTGHFGYTATGSNFYVKANEYFGKTKVTVYLSMQGSEINGSDYIMLGKAYISVNGLTVGKTYSYFMDLEAGPMTVDLQGPNTQIARVHNLIGYTKPLGQHWTVAAALEAPHTIGSSWQSYGVSSDYNKFPDFAMNAKFRGEKGHVQAGVILREVSYWTSTTGFSAANEGKTKYTSGFGMSLSGNYRPVQNLTFSAQGVWGKGVSYYIQDLCPLGLSLGMENLPDNDGYPTLKPLTAYGGYVSASYKWSEKLRSSVVYGLCGLENNGLNVADSFKRSSYVAANAFVYFSPYCFMGFEYLYGRKLIYAAPGAEDRGYANRFNMSICYRF